MLAKFTGEAFRAFSETEMGYRSGFEIAMPQRCGEKQVVLPKGERGAFFWGGWGGQLDLLFAFKLVVRTGKIVLHVVTWRRIKSI